MKLWHISDTHTYHDLLEIPPNTDVVVFSGDCSNPRDPYANEQEVRKFLTWFSGLPISHKIFVAGNHDTSIEKRLVDKQTFSDLGIIYLENEELVIDGVKFWGSPYTPTFGQWAFMKSRETINRVWEHIPDDTDVLITHGPPQGVLDLSYNRNNELELCGCSALRKRVRKIQPRLCLFGHIHNCEDIVNQGMLQWSGYSTIFSNGSVVTDGKFGKLSSNGSVFTL